MQNIPAHIGFIMDGNRRWAAKHSMPKLMGHKKGYDAMKHVVRWCKARDIKVVTFFAFSTENWNRSKTEITYLMRLLKSAVSKDLAEFKKEGSCLKVIGNKAELSPSLQKAIAQAEEDTKNNKDIVVQIAINYGGRAEIVQAVQRIVATGTMVTEKLIEQHLYTAGVPDPDLIIRTAGVQRLSGFLLWQCAYAELYFTPTFWPAFSEHDLDQAIAWYAAQKRNFGR